MKALLLTIGLVFAFAPTASSQTNANTVNNSTAANGKPRPASGYVELENTMISNVHSKPRSVDKRTNRPRRPGKAN